MGGLSNDWSLLFSIYIFYHVPKAFRTVVEKVETVMDIERDFDILISYLYLSGVKLTIHFGVIFVFAYFKMS